MDAITQVLNAVEQGDPRAAEQLLPLVYDELRKLAAHRLAGEGPGHTLQPTALVHEAYLKLVGPDPQQPWKGRVHFFASAAAGWASASSRASRSPAPPLSATISMLAESGGADELLALDEALAQLAAAD